MTEQEFQDIVSHDPSLSEPLKRAAASVPSQQFALDPFSMAFIVLMFPIAKYVLTQIGLPWLYEAKRYTELWRTKFDNWIDTQYDKHGLDPDQAEAAGSALRAELEKVTDANSRAAWERLAGLLAKGSDDKPSA